MLATMKCPACGRDVPVSEALYCPFCGQTLRRVFADGSTSAPQDAPAPVPASIPVSTAEAASSESSQSQPPPSWTPYPEQSAFQTAPATEQPTSGAAPATASKLVRNQSVVVSALAVILIGALLIFERVYIARFLFTHIGPAYFVGIFLPSLVLYSALALAAAYWLGWLRLATRRASQVVVEAVALGILLLSTEQMLIMLTLKWVEPSYLSNANAFIWFTYLTRHPALFMWTVLLSVVSGAFGTRLASSCARWSLVPRGARPATPVADFFKIYAACALLLVAAVVFINSMHIGSVFAANAVIVAALIAATLLAVRSGKRRLGTV